MLTPICRIIPQAVSVRYGLAVGATCAPAVLGMMYIMGVYLEYLLVIRPLMWS